jgi:hypothetical protein
MNLETWGDKKLGKPGVDRTAKGIQRKVWRVVKSDAVGKRWWNDFHIVLDPWLGSRASHVRRGMCFLRDKTQAATAAWEKRSAQSCVPRHHAGNQPSTGAPEPKPSGRCWDGRVALCILWCPDTRFSSSRAKQGDRLSFMAICGGNGPAVVLRDIW